MELKTVSDKEAVATYINLLSPNKKGARGMFSHASGLNNVVFWSEFSHDHCDLVFLNLIS